MSVIEHPERCIDGPHSNRRPWAAYSVLVGMLTMVFALWQSCRTRGDGSCMLCLSVADVVVGVTALMVSWWLFGEKKIASISSKGIEVPTADPKLAWCVKKAKPKEVREQPSMPDEISTPWWSCCCSRGDDELDGMSIRKELSYASNAKPWLTNGDILHPKFCGLRCDDASPDLPPLQRFALEPIEATAAPESFAALLPCSDEERRLCAVLRQQLADSPGPKDPVTMLRFLRARKGQVDVAANFYRKAMSWRRSNGLEMGFRLNTMDDALHRRLDAYWPPTAVMGFDRDGDAVYWNRMMLCDLDFLAATPSEFLGRHEVYCVTRILQALEEYSLRAGKPRFTMTVVVDLAGLSMKHMNIKAAPKYQHCVRIMEDNFPEIVKRIVVVRAPRLASTLWKVISKFFDEGTRNKIQIVDEGNTAEALNKFIEPKWVPRALGGLREIGDDPWCSPALPKAQQGVPRQLLQDIIAASSAPGFVGA